MLQLLILADREEDAQPLVRALQRSGIAFSWERADSAGALKRAFGDQVWDVIITDCMLKGMDAAAALELVRRIDPDVPFIVVSDATGEDLALEMMKLGADDYLMKDNLKRLAAAVERSLRDASSRRERQRVQRELKESEKRYWDLFENANDMIYVRDLEGNLIDANRTAERLLGFSRDEMRGRSLIELLTPDSRRTAADYISERLAGDETDAAVTLEVQCKDGRVLTVEVKARLIVESGKPVAIMGTARDVTERRNLEEQLQKALPLEAVGRLAGGVAHDFNNLLTVINGYASVVLQEMPLDDVRRPDIEQIEMAGKRAAALTNQLLVFGRSSKSSARTVDVHAALQELVTMLRRLLGESIELRVHTAEGPCLVRMNPSELDQILLNLALNAREAMTTGGVLTIRTGSATGVDSPMVCFEFADTGPGISESARAHLFEPFFTTKPHGTGLGLSIVQQIVEKNEGRIEIDSEPGRGATFRILFPPAAADQVEELASSGPALRGTETVAIVDDDAGVRRLTSTILRSNGYTFIECESAEDCLNKVGRHSGEIHLLLTDVIMPGLSGPVLAARFQEIRPGTPVLFVSGFPQSVLALEPAHAVLPKPYEPKTLLLRIREILDRADSQTIPTMN